MVEWKMIDFDDCKECGGTVEVLTDAPENQCYDGDKTRCMDCGTESGMSVDEDGSAYVQDA